jgi:hypothetical protein
LPRHLLAILQQQTKFCTVLVQRILLLLPSKLCLLALLTCAPLPTHCSQRGMTRSTSQKPPALTFMKSSNWRGWGVSQTRPCVKLSVAARANITSI